MTLHKLTAGDGYTYLTRQVAAHDVTQRGYDSLGDYYAEKGESPGVWMGSGCYVLPHFLGGQITEAQMVALFGEGRHPDAERIEAELRTAGRGTPAILAETRLGAPFVLFDGVNEFRRRCAEAFAAHNAALGLPADWAVPAGERATIRTGIARELFVSEYGRQAADPRELSGFLARISRQATTAVAGYDLTFSPVKSVSALWALAPRPIAEVIEQAHQDAVVDVLGWLENNAAFTRTGRAGVRQVEVNGLIAAAFTHRDSRAGDPDLHTHVAVSNKVQCRADGRWLALDGRPLHKLTVAASERYNTRLETLLRQRLGVRFVERDGGDPGKRPVREIAGVDQVILARWSQRRAQIDVRRAQLAAAFQVAHGRPPTTVEALALAQQANLETRAGKHEPRSRAEQRATWRAEAVATLGGETELHRMLNRVLKRDHRRGAAVTDAWVQRAADAVLLTVQSARATWQECHVRAEAERYARGAELRPEQVERAVDAVVAAALAPARAIPLGTPDPITERDALRRSDGTSVYVTAGTQLFTSSQILAAERRLLAHARTTGRRTAAATAVDLAVLEAAANGVELNPGQVQLVCELAGSGAMVQLALAPAGTGKTTAMRVLASAWSTADDAGEAGNVIGLAPSAAAAAVLHEAVGAHTDTLAKLLHALDQPVAERPAWVRSIGPATLVIVDEAGMAGTADLAQVVDYVAERGGSVRLVGDDRQLAAIGSGGVLRDIATEVGAVHLSQVLRFDDAAEGAATLALRAGDPAAIGYYLDHHRVHVGDLSTCTDSAYRAWAADRRAGKDSVLLAPTREIAAALNARARTDRLTTTQSTSGADVQLADGSQASRGDVIITRRNDRRLPITGTDFVKNGDRWTVQQVHADGRLTALHHATGRHVQLPASYVAEHVALGYATTVHAAQGITADTSHVVATGEETRQLLYVAATRGRIANHIHLAVAGDGEPHSVITRDALLPPTAADILARIITRDGSQISATSTGRDLAAAPARLHSAAARYLDALHFAADAHLGPTGLARLTELSEAAVPGVTAAESWPALRGHLALLTLDGAEPTRLLNNAAAAGALRGSRDIAAVLDWRLDPTGRRGDAGPLPWLPAVPQRLRDDPIWGDYLTRRTGIVTELATQVANDARTWTPRTAPAWTTGLLENRSLVADLAVWHAATGLDPVDPAPAGPRPATATEAHHHRRLTTRVERDRDHADAAFNLVATANALDPRVTGDPYWPQLAQRLAVAQRAGIDSTGLLHTAFADAPLPDEYPAAALWWRITRHLPAALTDPKTAASPLRPAWTADLERILGEDAAHHVVDDAAWPALVAAVSIGRDQGWQPADLLATAQGLLDSGHPDDARLRREELATALIWRIAALTHPAGLDMTDTSAPPPEP